MIAASDPDSNCHLQLGRMPQRCDKWHFYECSQSHKDKNVQNGPKTEEVNKVNPGAAYQQICHLSIEAQMLWRFYDCFQGEHFNWLHHPPPWIHVYDWLQLLTFPQLSTRHRWSPKQQPLWRSFRSKSRLLGNKCRSAIQIPEFYWLWRKESWREIEGGFCMPITTLGRITDNCD